MQRNSTPIPWRPQGLSDTLDASGTFAGAMATLQNLIPDPSTQGLFQCRPASVELVDFTTRGGGFSTGFSSGFETGYSVLPLGAISLFKIIGNYAYGMVATSRFLGYDEPFIYNLLTNQFVSIQGVTALNVPATPPSSGAWVPPTAALVGAKLVVTHPGFTGANGAYFGILDVTNPAIPQWSATNLSGTGNISFTTPPSAVFQFSSRAYYITNAPAQPAVIFSDTLSPATCSFGTQVLTFGDAAPLTALGGLMLQTTAGGIVQSLIVFKGVQNIYQITGDAALGDLFVNSLNIPTGTLAPNTVVSTPNGLAFMSPDGLRIINFYANVSTPIGISGQGVTVPFINSVVPSRMAAACGGNVLRISVQNGYAPGSPNQEYWYDLSRQIWTGPHTFPMSLIQPYNNSFVGQPIGLAATLWRSDVVQSSTSTFVENGQQMTWNWTTPMLPDTDQMTNNCMTEATLDLGLSPTFPTVTVNALDENYSVLNTVTVSITGTTTVWGSFLWGNANWGTTPAALAPRQLPWTVPVIFTRMAIQATGQSATGVRIGTMHLRYQILRYLSSIVAAA